MGLLDRLRGLFDGADDERLASDPLVLDTGTAGAAPVVPEADELRATDLRARAEEFADRNDGAGLGFTLESLARLDEVAAEQPTVLAYLDGAVDEEGRPNIEPGGRVLDFGSYAGEVLVAEFDGAWTDEDGWGVAVTVDTDPVTVPVFDLAARAVGGDPRFHEVGTELDAGRIPRLVQRPTASVRTAMAAATEEVSAYWDGYDLDVTPASLARLDDLVDGEWDAGRFRTARFGDGDSDSRVYTELVRHFGSYYGEVLTRTFDAEWTADPELGTVVDVAGQGGTAVANVFVVAADRLTDEERFALDFDVLAANLDLDAPPASEHGYEVVRADPGALEAVRGQDVAAVAATFEENAATLAGEWPAYDLDYTPASLARLDRLVGAEFDAFDLAGAELDGATDADSLVLTARALEAGGYLAAVFRRVFGGEWRSGDLEFVVRGRAAEATLDPVGIAAACLRGEGSFAATYRAIDDQLDRPVAGTAGEAGSAGGADAGATDAVDTAETGENAESVGPSVDDGPAAVRGTATDPADGRRDMADALSAAWPDYELDGSVESLVRLDALVAASFDRSGGDRDYEGDPLAPAETTDVPDDALPFGAYFGELLRRHHDATWRAETLVVTGDAGSVELEPTGVAAACFDGESSFLDAYAHVAARAGLETPLGDA